MSYDSDNIFAKILRGEIPAVKVYENDLTLCFMDIFPRSEGHCLVVPKTPCRNLLDADPDVLATCLATSQVIARAAKLALGADGITFQQFSEAAGGQEVFHLHFHILPRFEGVALLPPGQPGDMQSIQATAEKIRAAI